jgi:hypothetical protein
MTGWIYSSGTENNEMNEYWNLKDRILWRKLRERLAHEEIECRNSMWENNIGDGDKNNSKEKLN